MDPLPPSQGRLPEPNATGRSAPPPPPPYPAPNDGFRFSANADIPSR